MEEAERKGVGEMTKSEFDSIFEQICRCINKYNVDVNLAISNDGITLDINPTYRDRPIKQTDCPWK